MTDLQHFHITPNLPQSDVLENHVVSLLSAIQMIKSTLDSLDYECKTRSHSKSLQTIHSDTLTSLNSIFSSLPHIIQLADSALSLPKIKEDLSIALHRASTAEVELGVLAGSVKNVMKEKRSTIEMDQKVARLKTVLILFKWKTIILKTLLNQNNQSKSLLILNLNQKIHELNARLQFRKLYGLENSIDIRHDKRSLLINQIDDFEPHTPPSQKKKSVKSLHKSTSYDVTTCHQEIQTININISTPSSSRKSLTSVNQPKQISKLPWTSSTIPLLNLELDSDVSQATSRESINHFDPEFDCVRDQSNSIDMRPPVKEFGFKRKFAKSSEISIPKLDLSTAINQNNAMKNWSKLLQIFSQKLITFELKQNKLKKPINPISSVTSRLYQDSQKRREKWELRKQYYLQEDAKKTRAALQTLFRLDQSNLQSNDTWRHVSSDDVAHLGTARRKPTQLLG
ncbi:hypothetical protein RCL1_002315 [Eukaryota sp. TZLM3-RCL]